MNLSDFIWIALGSILTLLLQYFCFEPRKQRKERASNARITAIEHYSHFRSLAKLTSIEISAHASTTNPSGNFEKQRAIENKIKEIETLISKRELDADGALNGICVNILSELKNGLNICEIRDPAKLMQPGESLSANLIPISRREPLAQYRAAIDSLLEELDEALSKLKREDREQ